MKNFDKVENFKYQKAKKKAKDIRNFYFQLSAYCLVIPLLIFFNLTYMSEFHWFWFSMIGWGTGVIMHGLEVFELNPFFGKNWEERKLKQIIAQEKLKRQRLENNIKK